MPCCKKEKEEKEEKPKVPLRAVFRFAAGKDKLLMFIGTIFAIISGASLPAFSYMFQDLLDSIAGSGDVLESVGNVGKLGLILGAIAMTVVWIYTACFMTVGEVQSVRIREHLFKAILRQELAWYETHKAGAISHALTAEVLEIKEVMGEKLGQFIYNMSTFILSLIYAFYLSWRMTLIMMCSAPLLVISGAAMSIMVTKLANEGDKAYSLAGNIAQEVLSSIRTVVAFNGQSREADRYSVYLQKARKAGIKKGWVEGATVGIAYGIFFATYALAFWYGSYVIEWGYNTGGEVVACFFAFLIGAFSLGAATPFFATIASARAAAFTVFEYIDRVPIIDIDAQGRIQLPNLQGHIRLQSVGFRYPSRPDNELFRDFTLDVQPGKKVALVGHSGSGKSSVLSLVQRFYDPEDGFVAVDGHDERNVDLKWLRSQIGMVTQDPVLFSGSIRDNLSYASDDVYTEEQMVKACQDANIHDTIMKLPQKYDTKVGESGSQLSGGQRQRMCIARAILKNPKILLLDEATSALDRQSEISVQAALQTASAGRTTIVIAHRLVTIQDSDMIYFIQPPQSIQGTDAKTTSTVAEYGNHTELMALRGHYYGMVMAQKSVEPSAIISSDDEDREMPVRAHQYQQGSSSEPYQNTDRLKYQTRQQYPTTHEDVAIEMPAIGESSAKKKDDKTKHASMGRVASMAKPDLIWVIIAILAAGLSGLSYPVYALIFTELVATFYKTPQEMRDEAPKWALLFLGLAAWAATFTTLKMGMFSMTGERLTERVRLLLFKCILRQDMTFFDNPDNESGQLASTLSADTRKVHMLFGPNLGQVIQTVVMLGAGLVIAFIVSWKLTLVVLISVPLMVLAGFVNMMFMSGFSEKGGGVYSEANQIAVESVNGIRTVMAFNMQRRRWQAYCDKLAVVVTRATRRAIICGFFVGFTQLVMFATFAGSFWYGSKLIHDGELEFDDVIRCTMALLMSAMGVGETTGMGGTAGDAKVASEKVFTIIDTVPAIDVDQTTGSDPSNITGDVRLEDVEFIYPSRPDQKILRRLNLHVSAGKMLALIGSTGCGKSTVMQLMERYYDPKHGSLIVDGMDLRTVNLKKWRDVVSIVSQEPVLFDDTVFNNICYGKQASLDEVMQAAQIAQIHETIMDLPEQYETGVGPRGERLSGGQRQRVAIARAVLRRPKILLLDEATAALDNKSEAEVQHALDNVSKTLRITTISIAHRLTTIQNADVIAVIEEGRVLEMGSHDELYAQQGEYRRRYDVYHNLSH